MYLLVLYFPLISACIIGIFGRYIGNEGSKKIGIILNLLTCIVSWIIFYEVGLSGVICIMKLGVWLDTGLLRVSWGLLFDSLTVIMLIVITTISLFVNFFSISYMKDDPHFTRFMSYLSLFTFFMLVLVTADNYVQMFLGWEGVGLASYLLINFWYTRIQANKAAIKAIIVNKVGDAGLIISISLIFYKVKCLDFGVVFAFAYYIKEETINIMGYEINWILLTGLFLFIGVMGKSAQLGLHTWLPDAMEGPTPVSALIHAATMVTAGVFVLVRSSPLIEYNKLLLVYISVIGALTSFFAATVGLFQNDIKKVVAYSTCSQLGYMVFACGLSQYSVGIFHLFNHAFFKALLFLSAGSVIHAVLDEQDMRRMGGLLKILPFTYICFCIGSLSIMGFPFLTGFYSKDLILELTYNNIYIHGIFCYWLGIISAILTAFYSMRLIYLTFVIETNIGKGKIKYVKEGDIYIWLPMFLLCLCSICIGFFFRDMLVGVGTDFWGNAIFNTLETGIISTLEVEFEEMWVKQLPVICSIIGGFSCLILYYIYIDILYKLSNKTFFKKIYIFFIKKWFIDYIYNYFINKMILKISYEIIIKIIDRGFIEILGPTGLVRRFKILVDIIENLQNGKVYRYGYIIIICIMVILSINLIREFFFFSYDFIIVICILVFSYIYYIYTKN